MDPMCLYAPLAISRHVPDEMANGVGSPVRYESGHH